MEFTIQIVKSFFFLTLQLLVKATITVAANTVAAPDGNDKQIMLTN